MSLVSTVRLMTLLLVAVACLPVALSEEIPLAAWVVFAAGLLAGWFIGGRPWTRTFGHVVTGALILSFLVMLLRSIQSGEWLLNAIVFTLLAGVVRSWQLHTSRQQFQMVGLSFLMVIAASVTNPDISFAFFYLVYAVLLTWTLTYTHLVQRVEEAGGESGIEWKASRFVSKRFLLGSSVLALALLASSVLIFILFPRLGLGFFSAQTRRADPISGFSDSIELGHFGNLKDSGRVVLRVEVVSGMEHLPPEPLWKFRGMSFEQYDGVAWSKRRSQLTELRPGPDHSFEVSHWPRLHSTYLPRVEYDIYQEPLETENKVVFGIPRALSVSPVATRFDRFRGTGKTYFQDREGDVTFAGPSMTSTSYTVVSGIPNLSPERLRKAEKDYPTGITRHIRRVFTQLPPALDPRVASLAMQAAGGATNWYDTAVNVEGFLQENFGYTTEGEGEVADPVSSFLFERRKGHCEYFATAMVIMLRSLGLPARPVNGFLGAKFNEFGNYYTVTEGMAHSWVEVFFPGWGWVTFDPTPPVERLPQGEDFFSSVALWADSVKLQWYKWVVEYDLEKQLSVYVGLWNLMAPREGQVSFSPDSSISEMRREFKKIGKGLFNRTSALLALAGVLLVVSAPLAWRWWRNRRRGRPDPLAKLAARLRSTLRRKGLSVLPGTTLPSLVRQAAASGFQRLPSLALLVALLEEARWSKSPAPDLPALERLVREVAGAPALRKAARPGIGGIAQHDSV
jgi:transglutaminase-like putative cysteine protease